MKLSTTLRSACAALLLVCALSTSPYLHAQIDDRATGTNYYLAFPDTTTNTFNPSFPNKMGDKILLYIYSTANDNTITITGRDYSRVVTAQRAAFTTVDLTDARDPAPYPIVVESCNASANTFHVVAEQPIILYCYICTTFGCEAWTPMPVDRWGQTYYAAARPGEIGMDVATASAFNYIALPKQFPAEILVIASEDNTNVTIYNNGVVLNCSKLSVDLMAGQAYQIQSYVDTSNPGRQADLGGSYIVSTKPIGVLSGNTRAMVLDEFPGLAKNAFKNMLMEWLPSVEQSGTEFVYMPTMDDRRPTGMPGEDLSSKRAAEFVRVYATNPQLKKTTGFYVDTLSGAKTSFTINKPREFFDHRIMTPKAVYYKTDSASLAFMNSSAVTKFLGTTGSGNNIGASYDGWSPYMVEMVPRENWVNAAPFVTPAHPAGMEHFVNVATDSASAKRLYWGKLDSPLVAMKPFPATTKVPGSRFVWGSARLDSGAGYFLMGWNPTTEQPDTSVRFYGFAYGMLTGHEEYRPGGPVSDYKEYLGVAYGYPLAPSRSFRVISDSLLIETLTTCDTMNVHVKALNANPVGLRTISLASVTNAKIVFVNPNNAADIIGKPEATFNVVAINTSKDASATVVIKDRTDKVHERPYVYEAPRFDGLPSDDVNFGVIAINQPSTRTITLSNPLTRYEAISSVALARGDQGFRILSTTPPTPGGLAPGATLSINVEMTPTQLNTVYRDTILIAYDCSQARIGLVTEPTVLTGVEDATTIGYLFPPIVPNPTDGMTTIEYSVGGTAAVRIDIIDVLGQRIATLVDESMSAGTHRAMWDASTVAAGLYRVRIAVGSWTRTQAILVR